MRFRLLIMVIGDILNETIHQCYFNVLVREGNGHAPNGSPIDVGSDWEGNPLRKEDAMSEAELPAPPVALKP